MTSDDRPAPGAGLPVHARTAADDAPRDPASPDRGSDPVDHSASPSAPTRRAASDEVSISEAVRDQLGGVRGMVESSVPLLVFIVANMALELRAALWAAVGSAAAIAAYRLVRRDSVRHAVNGLLAVGIAALIASRTGRAEDFYLVNIGRNAAGVLAFAISAAVRRPLVGYAWAFVTGAHADWRARPRLLRTFTLLSLMWAATFGVRVAVQVYFYLAGNADALGVVSLVLGWPLFGAVFALTLWVGRRAVRADRLTPA